MLRHNYHEEAIQIINEIPKTKIKEVIEVWQKYKRKKSRKEKNEEEHRKVVNAIHAMFKGSASSSYEFAKRKKIEKKLDL